MFSLSCPTIHLKLKQIFQKKKKIKPTAIKKKKTKQKQTRINCTKKLKTSF